MNYEDAEKLALKHKNLIGVKSLFENYWWPIYYMLIAPKNTEKEIIAIWLKFNKDNRKMLDELNMLNDTLEVFLIGRDRDMFTMQSLDDYLLKHPNENSRNHNQQ